MGTLVLQLRGVNAYVPSKDGKSLMVVMPNATRLGKSKRLNASDGTPLARHMPMLWESKEGDTSFLNSRIFPAARLTFDLDGATTALDLASLAAIADSGWLDVDPYLLEAVPDERLGGQVLITAGVVTPLRDSKCAMKWSHDEDDRSLLPVVQGLTVTIGGVERVRATVEPWVDAGSGVVLDRVVPYAEKLELSIGNVCAEDVLDWPRNSVDNRASDEDFRWLYLLARKRSRKSPPLAVPNVVGSTIRHDDDVFRALDTAFGGGGATGCQCSGCVDQPGGG